MKSQDYKMRPTKGDSRGPQLDMVKCANNVGGVFNLVLIGAIRAREIARQHRSSENPTMVRGPVDALLEIQEGKIGKEYLQKLAKR